MIQSYDDLYTTIESSIEQYSKTEDSVEMVFQKNDNGTCVMMNKANRKKFVFMFAKFGDEYKVGFALYIPDAYGAAPNPEWIEDIFHNEFDTRFVQTLITEHLIADGQEDNGW